MAHWRQSGAGAGRAITNTTSPAGTNPLPGMRVVLAHIDDAALQSVAAYDVSKFGTVALTEVLAMESAAEGLHGRRLGPRPRDGAHQATAPATAQRTCRRGAGARRRQAGWT